MFLHISGTQKKKLTISDTQRKIWRCTQKITTAGTLRRSQQI